MGSHIIYHQRTFSDAIRQQARVIGALVRREMLTRFGKRKIGYAWVIIEPLIQVAIFLTLRKLYGATTVRDVSAFSFLIAGIVPYYYLMNVIRRTLQAIPSNQGLLVFPQITFMDLFYSRLVLETATYTIIFTGCLTALEVINGSVNTGNIAGIYFSFLLIGFFGFGFGLIGAALYALFESATTYINILVKVTYYASGILFSINIIPLEYHGYLKHVPTVHLFEIIRHNCFAEFTEIEYFLDYKYVLFFASIQMLIGLLLIKRVKKWLLR